MSDTLASDTTELAFDPQAGIAAAAAAESAEILNLLGEQEADGSCCGGSCCAA